MLDKAALRRPWTFDSIAISVIALESDWLEGGDQTLSSSLHAPSRRRAAATAQTAKTVVCKENKPTSNSVGEVQARPGNS